MHSKGGRLLVVKAQARSQLPGMQNAMAKAIDIQALIAPPRAPPPNC